MRPSRLSALILLGLGLSLPARAAGQWEISGKAALPAVPYWIPVSESSSTDVMPLLWTNYVDGGDDNGCCVIGAAVRSRVGSATLWLGLAFGTDPDGGTPAAIEAAAQIHRGTMAFRKLHGRIGFTALFPLRWSTGPVPWELDRISFGVSSVWVDDSRYLETIPLFDCVEEAPTLPCQRNMTPYTWSDGRDNGLIAEGVMGRGDWRQPRVRGSGLIGLRVAGGEHEYVRLEAEARVTDRVGTARLDARLAGGWSSGGAPQQRRFLLEGADPVTRWLNPYIDARGALFSDIPYFVPGGPYLRVYEATRPLVRRYLGAAATISGLTETESGLWGRGAAYLAAAWTPGIPDRMGPGEMNDAGDLLFDWRELPDGEGREGGQFRASSLEVSEIWADAGLELTGGYRRVAVTISLPLWASQPAFASESLLAEEKSAFAFRWALSIVFQPSGRPGG